MKQLTFSKVIDIFERLFVILSLILYTGGVLLVIITNGTSEGDGVDILSFNYSLNNYCFILNYLIVSALLVLRWKKTLATITTGDPFFVILILLIPGSFLWSVKPDETITGSIGMIGTTLFGLYLASRFTLKQQLSLLCWSFGISIILSFIFIALLPKYGIMGAIHAGKFRGIYTHKNGLGKVMVLSNSLFLIQARDHWKSNRWMWLGVVGSMALIVGSQSTAALLNGIMLMIVILTFQIFQLRTKMLIQMLILMAAGITIFSFWALDIAELVLGSFDKDLTLTGRADIWPYVLQKIQERPWLGYGFNGFWHGIHGESIFVRLALRWPVPDSHNGYLDFIINMGLFGFALFLLSFWTTLLKNIALIRRKFSWVYVWPVTFLAYLAIINFTESTLLGQNGLPWVLYTTVVLSISKAFNECFSKKIKPENKSQILASH